VAGEGHVEVEFDLALAEMPFEGEEPSMLRLLAETPDSRKHLGAIARFAVPGFAARFHYLTVDRQCPRPRSSPDVPVAGPAQLQPPTTSSTIGLCCGYRESADFLSAMRRLRGWSFPSLASA
jgi:hypothetical protein